MGVMFIYYRTYWRFDGLFPSKGKLKKVDQTTILANDFKGSFTGADIFLLTVNFYMLQTVEANTISILRFLKRKIRIEEKKLVRG
jgi:hypothetical protein